MILKPNKTKFINNFKKRSYLSNTKKPIFFFGSLSVITKTSFYLVSKHFSKIKLLFKKINKKADKTKRFIFFNTFPNFPLSKKPQGLRMGKGTGKLNTWFSKIKSGSNFIETKGIRFGRLLLFVLLLKFSNYSNFSIKKIHNIF